MSKIHEKIALTKSKSIEQYDLNNNHIKTWPSTSAAAKDLNFNKCGISSCCLGRKKTYKNFKWCFSDDPDLPDEIWCELNNELEGLYISNKGRYKSKYMNKSYGTNQNNYIKIVYKTKTYSMANLVLIAFVGDPPTNEHQAYHIDNDTTNNKLENLKWCILKNMINHNHNKMANTISKQIIQIKNDIEINKYNSIKEASILLNINESHISECINKKRNITHAGGFQWKYVDDPDLENEIWKIHTKTNIIVSNKGRIKTRHGKYYGTLGNQNYYRFKNMLVHRLIAETFIDNIENKKTVDHIDRNTTNNCVENLRWATYKEQIKNRETY